MSCTHYLRKCKLEAACCGKIHECRICHDVSENHEMDRKAVKTLVCVQCDTHQNVGKNCSSCGILFGTYSCLICRLFDDNDKGQFHCQGCGICRVGGDKNFFHCPKCNICIKTSIKETHKCIEDISRRMCPVCLEDLHASTKKAIIPKCSHMIHDECQQSLLKFGFPSCPLCRELVM